MMINETQKYRDIEEYLTEEEERIFLQMMRETNWKINQVIKDLQEEIPFEIIVNSLMRQAIEVAYHNFEDGEGWKEMLRDFFEFQMAKVEMQPYGDR